MRYIFAILICLFSLSVSAQDQIQIRNLGTVNGQITSFTRDHVFLKLDTSTKKLRYDVIEAIKMKDPERLRSEIVLYRHAALLVYGRYVNLTIAEQLKMDSITKATLADTNRNLSNQTISTYEGKMYWTAEQHYNRGNNLLVATGVFYVASFLTAVFVPDMIKPETLDDPIPSNITTSQGYLDFMKKVDEAQKDYDRNLTTVKVVSGVFSLVGTICLFSANTNFKMGAYKSQQPKLSFKASPSSATIALQF